MNKKELLEELKKEGFSDNIIRAFDKVKREDFISEEFKQYAYENEPLPIGKGATISQPYTIAFMLDLLELDNKKNLKILEIGSGCGYVLALINQLSKDSKIYGVEINKEVIENSKKILKKNKNIKVFYRDGSKGLKNKAPFDRILISADAGKIPAHLYPQLKDKGILVTPVGNSIYQIKKINKQIREKEHYGFVFVPLVR